MEGRETVIVAGKTYVSCPLLSYGDYGGAGSVGKANVVFLERKFEKDHMHVDYGSFMSGCAYNDTARRDIETTAPVLVIVEGAFDYHQAFLRHDVASLVFSSLDDYAVLDEDVMSEVEVEWETEAWASWVKADLLHHLPEDVRDRLELLPEDKQETLAWEAYQKAMDDTNTYPVSELNGVHIATDEIEEDFAKNIAAAMEAK